MTCADCDRVCEGRLCRDCERDRCWEDRFDDLGQDDDDDDDAGAAPVVADGGDTLDESDQRVDACPGCGASNIYCRTGPRYGEAERWACYECGHTFAEPVQRPPRKRGGNYASVGTALREADPDDFATDGGVEAPVCAIDGCELTVHGLTDGRESVRGVICTACSDYYDRHGHWPDDDVDHCPECRVDAGAVRHDCPDPAADSVIFDPEEGSCPFCGFEGDVATDGGLEVVDVRFPPWILEEVDRLVDEGIYQDREAAIQAAVRDKVQGGEHAMPDGGGSLQGLLLCRLSLRDALGTARHPEQRRHIREALQYCETTGGDRDA